MGKPMSKTAIMAHFAKKFDIKKKDAVAFFEELANLAYKEAKNSFTLPGIGKGGKGSSASQEAHHPIEG